MKKFLNLSKKNFAIYGLGSTGLSVINYFKKINFNNYTIWDDSKKLKKKWNLDKLKKESFIKSLKYVDYIVLSPGINLNNAQFRKEILANKSKIISDLDLFYMFNSSMKSIVVTGTNGKSTTCKIIHHVLKKNKINSILGGNIGKPILSLNFKENPYVIIEASSFQLAYSNFVKPNFAIILNISNDHLDWHKSMNNYINSKFKIFSLQKKKNYALINNQSLIKKYKRKKYLGKLIFINSKNYSKIKNQIKNSYLNSKANDENMSFVFALSKLLKIKEKSLIQSLESFKGLSHRHEIFLKKNNKIFINDSKATSFQASKFALESNKNIFWIVGGKPKIGDKFNLVKLKKNIIKSYIIGKNLNKFKNLLGGKVNYELCRSLKNAIFLIFKDIKKFNHKDITVLLSPASASYDQYENFEERGNEFKKLIKTYAGKYL